MAQIMTTKELAEYVKLHEITIGKRAAEVKIPGIRIGKVWRFDKNVVDRWILGSHGKPEANSDIKGKGKTKRINYLENL